MDELTIPGDPPIAVTLRPSARARRMTLRVSRLDGRVTLSLPSGTPARTARDFAHEKAGWIRKHLSAQPEALVLRPGGELPFEGRPHLLAPGKVRAPVLGEGVITVPQSAPERTGARLRAFLKMRARDRLAERAGIHASRLGREVTGLTLRDPRSRWGSCSGEGRLMFSWRLIMAPPPVLDYVAAHEAAHLVEMNHAPAFWALVEELMPGYRAHKAWLREHGGALHRYRFGD